MPLERVHVVGAGVMGGDIAAWSALRGLTVTQASWLEAAADVGPKVKSIFEYENRNSFTALVEKVWFQLPVKAWAGPPCSVSNGGNVPGLLKKSGVSEPSERR